MPVREFLALGRGIFKGHDKWLFAPEGVASLVQHKMAQHMELLSQIWGKHILLPSGILAYFKTIK